MAGQKDLQQAYAPDEIVAEDMKRILSACEREVSSLAGKTVLITGGSGFVGSYLVETIAAYNKDFPDALCTLLLPTRSLDAVRRKFPHLVELDHIVWIEWDGKSLELDHKVDYVIHAASPVEPDEYLADAYNAMQQMVGMTNAVLGFCKKASVSRMLFVSSGAVYGAQPADMDRMHEDFVGVINSDDPRSCYAEAKRYCEMLCRLSGVPVLVARLFSFVGPYMDLAGSYAIASFIRSADETGEVVLNSDGSSQRSFCYASDLAIILWKLLSSGKTGQIYNVGCSEPVVTVSELAENIAYAMGATVRKNGHAEKQARQRYVPDVGKSERLHMSEIGLHEGLQRTLDSFYAQGRIGHRPKRGLDESI